MENSLVITNKEQLLLLLSNSGFDRIEVNLPNINKDCNKYWSTKIQKEYNACGCKTGYRFMITGIVTSIFYTVFYFNSFMDSPFSDIVKLFVFIIIMAVLGKFLGLLIAKVKLKRYVDEVKNYCPN